MEISLQELAQNAVHFGHKTARWNPQMKPYIFGEKRGIHIIDLHQTKEKLESALTFLKRIVDNGGTILFVSTKPQTRALFEEFHQQTGHPIVVNKWVGGQLTNFSTMRTRIKYLKSLREMFATGEVGKFTKKEQSKLAKEMEKLEASFGGVSEMYRTPDAIFVVDGKRDESALKEAKTLDIPVIGIADTNVNPDYYSHIIPGNDDAIASLTYLLSFVFQTVKSGKKSGTESQKSASPLQKEVTS